MVLDTVVKSLESSLDCKEVKPVNPKGNQPWIFNGRTDTEAEAPILWPHDVYSQLIGKDPDAGKDWRQEETGTMEDKKVGWHHQLNGHDFEELVKDREVWHAALTPWGRKDLDKTEQLNNNKTFKFRHSARNSLYLEYL